MKGKRIWKADLKGFVKATYFLYFFKLFLYFSSLSLIFIFFVDFRLNFTQSLKESIPKDILKNSNLLSEIKNSFPERTTPVKKKIIK